MKDGVLILPTTVHEITLFRITIEKVLYMSKNQTIGNRYIIIEVEIAGSVRNLVCRQVLCFMGGSLFAVIHAVTYVHMYNKTSTDDFL